MEESDLEKTVIAWTTDEGIFRQKVKEDKENKFNILTEYPSGSKRPVHIVQPKGSDDVVRFISRLILTSEIKTKLDSLSSVEKDEFLWDLRFGLLQVGLPFQFTPSDQNLNEIHIFSRVFSDEFTKDRFMKELDENYRCFIFISWKFQRKFGPVPGMDAAPPMHG